MTKDEYLEEHHQTTETYIGIVHMLLTDARYDEAKIEIEKCISRIDDISGNYRKSLQLNKEKV